MSFELEMIVLKYMKSKTYNRSSTLFERFLQAKSGESPVKSSDDFSIVLRRFNAYLLENKKATESDDLGFEINFDFIPTNTKVKITFPLVII